MNNIVFILKIIRRKLYSLRTFIPGMRMKHKLEHMVGPLGNWDKLQRYQLNVLQQNGLKPCHSLLDVGCGPLQGGIAFINYLEKEKYVGFDISPQKIDAGYMLLSRNKLSYKKPFITVSESLGNNELANRRFDFIWASQILYHLDDNKLHDLFQLFKTRLRPDGKFLGDIIESKYLHLHNTQAQSTYYIHSVDSLRQIADNYALNVRPLNELIAYGYPRRISLAHNTLIEITFKNIL